MTRRARPALAAALVGLALSAGCWTTVVTGPEPDRPPDRSYTYRRFLLGFVGWSYWIHTGRPMVRVDMETTFADVLLRGITFGIYWPMSVDVWFADEAPPEAPPAPDGG